MTSPQPFVHHNVTTTLLYIDVTGGTYDVTGVSYPASCQLQHQKQAGSTDKLTDNIHQINEIKLPFLRTRCPLFYKLILLWRCIHYLFYPRYLIQ